MPSNSKKSRKLAPPDLVDKIVELFSLKGVRSNDNDLSAIEIQEVIKCMVDLSDDNANYQTYEKCRDLIIDILRSHNYTPAIPNEKNVNGMQHIPLSIKVLLWYMSYRAFELYNKPNTNKKSVAKPGNQAILNFIANKGQGYSLSKKTLADAGMSPKKYYDLCHYEQIKLPIKYAGAKQGHLGYALNYLVGFAGDFENFLDIFGGAGYASLAVSHKRGVDYYINEFDFCNINYFNVLADDKLYGLFKDMLKELRKNVEILMNNGSKNNVIVWYDESKERLEQWHSKYDYDKHEKKDGTCKNYVNYQKESDDEKVKTAVAFVFYNSFQVTGGSHYLGKTTSKSKIINFCNYSLDGFDQAHEKFKTIRAIRNCDALGTDRFIVEEFYDKASKMYKRYEGAYRALREESINKSSTYKFMSAFAKDGGFNGLASRLGYSDNKSARGFRTLYYSDSPYLETKGYSKSKNDDVNKADGDITLELMHNLIDDLIEASHRDNYFIFSCRLTVPASGASDITKGLSVQDKEIVKLIELYEVFKILAQDPILNGRADSDDAVSYVSFEKWVTRDKNGKLLDEDDRDYVFIEPKHPMDQYLAKAAANHVIYKELFMYLKQKAIEFGTKLYVLVCFNSSYEEDMLLRGIIKSKETESESTSEVREHALEYLLQTFIPAEIFITNFNFVEPIDYRYVMHKGSKNTQGVGYRYFRYTFDDFCDALDKYMICNENAKDMIAVEDNGGYIFKRK